MTLAIPLIFGLIVAVLYSVTLRRRIGTWRRYRDGRATRELLSGIALFIAAIASAASIIVVAFGLGGPDLRRTFAGVAWGTFAAAGVVFAQEKRREDET